MSSQIFIRIKKEGQPFNWEHIEIDKCSEAQLIEFFQDKDKNQVVHWLVSVLETLNAQIEQLRSGRA